MHCCHSPSSHRVSRKHNRRLEWMCHTSVENKPVNTNNLIAGHTNLFDKLLLVTHSTQRSHKPTITITPLTNIRSRRPINKKLRLLKDFLFRHKSASHPNSNL